MRIHTNKRNIYEWLVISSNDGHKFIVLGLNNPFKKSAILFNISCSFSKYTEFVEIILIFYIYSLDIILRRGVKQLMNR